MESLKAASNRIQPSMHLLRMDKNNFSHGQRLLHEEEK